MSEEVSKRSMAEARRQKLLARGKDRLQQITQGQPQKDVADHCAEVPHMEIGRESQNIDAATPLQTSLCSVDQSLTRSHSLPQEATQPLEADANEPLPVRHAETAARPENDQPMSPPPNTLWNTPRASDRNRSGGEAAQIFTASAEEPKMANWAKYNEQAAELISKADKTKAKLRQISWHQASSACLITHTRGNCRCCANDTFATLVRSSPTDHDPEGGQVIDLWRHRRCRLAASIDTCVCCTAFGSTHLAAAVSHLSVCKDVP